MISCEKCGRLVQSLENEHDPGCYAVGMHYNKYFIGNLTSKQGYSLKKSYVFDLCPECAAEMLEFVKNGKR